MPIVDDLHQVAALIGGELNHPLVWHSNGYAVGTLASVE